MKGKVITFRVTEEEYKRIQERTKQSGIARHNVSEYVRRQVLGEEYPYVKEKLLWNMAYQIRKIGVNINQITARNNSHLYLADDKEQLHKNMKELIHLFLIFKNPQNPQN